MKMVNLFYSGAEGVPLPSRVHAAQCRRELFCLVVFCFGAGGLSRSCRGDCNKKKSNTAGHKSALVAITENGALSTIINPLYGSVSCAHQWNENDLFTLFRLESQVYNFLKLLEF